MPCLVFTYRYVPRLKRADEVNKYRRYEQNRLTEEDKAPTSFSAEHRECRDVPTVTYSDIMQNVKSRSLGRFDRLNPSGITAVLSYGPTMLRAV